MGYLIRFLISSTFKTLPDIFSTPSITKPGMDRIIAYKDEKVVFGKVTNLSDKTAEVQSEVTRSPKPIPIHYRMILENGEWKVYDVVIEGVSLVHNYRTQFREILMNKTPEDLLKTLREKTRK